MSEHFKLNDSYQLKKKLKLESCLVDKAVFIDTCSVITPGVERFTKEYMWLAKESNVQFFLCTALINELRKRLEDENTKKGAIAGLKCLEHLHRHKFCKIIGGNQQEQFYDNQLQTFFEYYIPKNQLTLITQDNGLASEILKLNSRRPDRFKDVTVYELQEDGSLREWRLKKGVV